IRIWPRETHVLRPDHPWPSLTVDCDRDTEQIQARAGNCDRIAPGTSRVLAHENLVTARGSFPFAEILGRAIQSGAQRIVLRIVMKLDIGKPHVTIAGSG